MNTIICLCNLVQCAYICDYRAAVVLYYYSVTITNNIYKTTVQITTIPLNRTVSLTQLPCPLPYYMLMSHTEHISTNVEQSVGCLK